MMKTHDRRAFARRAHIRAYLSKLVRRRVAAWVFALLASILMTPFPCWADYDVGLAIPSAEGDTERMVREIRRGLDLFKSRLKGSLGKRLKEEFGVDPPTLNFVVKECPENDPPCASRAAQEFVRSKCLAVIGHLYSEAALEAGKTYDRERMVLITPTATHPEIAKASNRVFRLTFDAEWEGAVIAAYVFTILKRSNPTVMYEDNAYGRGLVDGLLKQVYAMGRTPPRLVAITPEILRPSSQASDHSEKPWASADAIVAFTYRHTGAKLFRRVRESGTKIVMIFSDDALSGTFAREAQKICDKLGEADPNLLAASPFFYELAPLKAYEFKRLYERRYIRGDSAGDKRDSPSGGADGAPDSLVPYPGLFVDAALLITRGIMAGAADGKSSVEDLRQSIFSYMDTLDSPETAVDGITGKLYFDDDGDMRRPVLFGRLEKGAFKPAYAQLARVDPDRVGVGSPGEEGDRARTDDATIIVNGVPMKPRHVVYTGVNLYRIDHINLLSQTFAAEFFLWFKWKEPLDLTLNQDTIFFWNSVYSADDRLVRIEQRRRGDLNYTAFRVNGRFLDDYDLRNYPFDSQELGLRMSLPKYGTDRALLAVDDETDYASDRFSIFPKEYEHLSAPEHTSGTLPLNASFGDPGRRTAGGADYEFSVYQVRFGVTRNPFPYLVKMFLPLALLIGVCLAVFWVPMVHFQVRVTLVLTALLSTIVFHMSRAGRLPNVGYLTLADKFFVVSYIVMSAGIAAIIWIEWAARAGMERKAEALNSGSRYLITGLTVFTFLTLGLPAIEKWYFRALTGVGLLFSVWLVYEFVRLNPSVRRRVGCFLNALLIRFRGGGS